jgi:hypothetical protein
MDQLFPRVEARHAARLASIGLSIDLPLLASQFGLGGVSDFHFAVLHHHRREPLWRFALSISTKVLCTQINGPKGHET